MIDLDLTKNDINVLEKINDPESDPARRVVVDDSLPKDPHVSDPETYHTVSSAERDIIRAIQTVEMQLARLQPHSLENSLGGYMDCVRKLDSLIDTYPNYASARNNRAQAYRRLYGDVLLVHHTSDPRRLIQSPDEESVRAAAVVVLGDLDTAVDLLSPATPSTPISPQNMKTLSAAHTQRATIYHSTAKLLPSGSLTLPATRREAGWSKMGFETAASQDFAMGGRYGSEVARGLAVALNPTAKLCGQIVQEAMKKEYGSAYQT
ncbi:hypothetical protein BROUX41_005820 [Berkeleyomyces rouxiae]|uniref:uncharacterized protein n=1 Tax=Berkeleyomyces rouxiae TaxID=2035830 RepID=UPI003B7BB7E7